MILIPSIDDDRFFFKHLALCFRQVLFMDNGFVYKVLEIFLGTDEITAVAYILAPGIFNCSTVGHTCLIKMNAYKDHGMRCRTAVILEAPAFGHSC